MLQLGYYYSVYLEVILGSENLQAQISYKKKSQLDHGG